jgi:hypothetical protein
MGRAGKRRGDLPTGDRGHRSEILGYWNRSAKVGDAVSRLALTFPVLRLNEPGPGQGYQPRGSSFELSRLQRRNFMAVAASGHKPITDKLTPKKTKTGTWRPLRPCIFTKRNTHPPVPWARRPMLSQAASRGRQRFGFVFSRAQPPSSPARQGGGYIQVGTIAPERWLCFFKSGQRQAGGCGAQRFGFVFFSGPSHHSAPPVRAGVIFR